MYEKKPVGNIMEKKSGRTSINFFGEENVRNFSGRTMSENFSGRTMSKLFSGRTMSEKSFGEDDV